MILESITRDAFAREAGLVTDGGQVSERGLADLLRSPLCRWGLSPRSAVLRYARDQLEAAGLRDRASNLLPKVMERLLRLGECEEFSIGHERCIAPVPPRWIRTGEKSATLLSMAQAPDGVVEQGREWSGNDLVRRIRVQSDGDLAMLRIAGVRETSLDEWLRPQGYLEHGRRRAARLIRNDEFGLSGFWNSLVSAVVDQGLPLGDDAEVRAVVGEPGGYFGQYNSDGCEGRWSNVIPDGVWCAYRRGYGPMHWQPIILAVDGGQRRGLDLHDSDEWRWALIARGHDTGVDELVDQVDCQVRLTFPAPDQIVAAMDILGPRRGAWSWEVARGAPDPWSALRGSRPSTHP